VRDSCWPAGRRPPVPQEVGLARRLLTDLVDDLRGGLTGLERSWWLMRSPARPPNSLCLSTMLGGASGKWLARQLAAVDSRLADDLAAAAEATQQGKAPALISVAERVVERAGGPLRVGWTDPLEELHSDAE
jgi:hypothetical protein